MTQDTDENAPQTAAPGEGEAQGSGPDARVAKLEAELAESKDRLLRTLAESENQRRRAQREREDAQRYAASTFAKAWTSQACCTAARGRLKPGSPTRKPS